MTNPGQQEQPRRGSRWQWGLYLAGAVGIAYGFIGLFTSERAPSLVAWARFWLGGVIAHDFVLAPVAAVLAAGLVFVVPRPARGYVLAGAVISAVVTIVALPFVLGRGRSADLPSALPLNYGRGLLVTLLAVWSGIAAVAFVARAIRRRRAAASYGAGSVE